VHRNLRGRRSVLSAGIAIAIAGTLLGAAPAHAGGPSPLDPQRVRGSVEYLRATYRISEAEALRRLRLQAAAGELETRLRSRAAGSYAGMWIDHEHGGRLVVAAKTPAEVARLARGATVVRVRYSLAELAATRQRLAVQLGDGPDSVLLPRVSEETNQVVVWKRDWLLAPRTAMVDSALDRAVAASGGMVVVRSLPKPNQLTTKNDVNQCHPLYCVGYGAMRGGIRLDIQRDDGSWGGCTSGFNVRANGGAYAGRPFVLTAGHCVVSARHQHQDTAYHEGNLVLREQDGLAVNNFPYDFALLPYADQATEQQWLTGTPEHNLVLAWCRNGGMDSDADTPCADGDQNDDGRIHIVDTLRAENVHNGFIVCATGAGASSVDYTDVIDSGAGAGYRPGTRCGRVTGQSNGAIDTDLCARAGDSGGPLFSEVTNSGIGILEGNTQDRSGPCQAGETNNYVPLSTIFDYVNAQPGAAGSTFSVITTTQG
jgi:streptogrisin C